MPRSGRVGHEGEAVWRVADGLLTVESAYDTVTTQLGEMPPEVLARMTLSEMIRGLHQPGQVQGLPRVQGEA